MDKETLEKANYYSNQIRLISNFINSVDVDNGIAYDDDGFTFRQFIRHFLPERVRKKMLSTDEFKVDFVSQAKQDFLKDFVKFMEAKKTEYENKLKYL